MISVQREKIALLIFIALALGGFASLVAYLNIGHNWNVTATTIDDAAGELEGYTVILFPGSNPPLLSHRGPQKHAHPDTFPYQGEDLPLETQARFQAMRHINLQHEQEYLLPKNIGLSTLLRGSAVDAERLRVPHEILRGEDEESSYKEPLSINAVYDSYQNKGALVFMLNTREPQEFSRGLIIKKGEMRFGICYADPQLSLARQQAVVDMLRRKKVDFVVCISPDNLAAEKLEGLDIVISQKDEQLFLMGQTIRGVFYVDAPPAKDIGAVLISPHKVLTAKDVSSL